MLKSSVFDYIDVYILASGVITITTITKTIRAGADDNAKRLDERNKVVIFKNCAPFTEFISELSNIQIDNTKDSDVVMPMYDLIE